MEEKRISQLRYDPESDCMIFEKRELHCGEYLEVLVCNGLNGDKPEWVETRIEYGEDWYLEGLWGYQVAGLFARTQ